MKNLMEYVGIEPERVQMAWVSASEGARWAKMIHDVTDEIRQLGPMKQIPRREIP
jgi:coenzyme F420-reducing hydrogenase delta subunit